MRSLVPTGYPRFHIPLNFLQDLFSELCPWDNGCFITKKTKVHTIVTSGQSITMALLSTPSTALNTCTCFDAQIWILTLLEKYSCRKTEGSWRKSLVPWACLSTCHPPSFPLSHCCHQDPKQWCGNPHAPHQSAISEKPPARTAFKCYNTAIVVSRNLAIKHRLCWVGDKSRKVHKKETGAGRNPPKYPNPKSGLYLYKSSTSDWWMKKSRLRLY